MSALRSAAAWDLLAELAAEGAVIETHWDGQRRELLLAAPASMPGGVPLRRRIGQQVFDALQVRGYTRRTYSTPLGFDTQWHITALGRQALASRKGR